jgi:SpoVK/Ycf46/Vps4 family AAA+-type ATPase
MEKLVLRVPSTIGMIKGLCEQYTERQAGDSVFFADVIEGKGEGNIILLHGPPGTGKTLTAGL